LGDRWRVSRIIDIPYDPSSALPSCGVDNSTVQKKGFSDWNYIIHSFCNYHGYNPLVVLQGSVITGQARA
jgi:hypothetical protein